MRVRLFLNRRELFEVRDRLLVETQAADRKFRRRGELESAERVDVLRTELRRVPDLGQSDDLRRAARRQKQKETKRRGKETRGARSPGVILLGAGFENGNRHVSVERGKAPVRAVFQREMIVFFGIFGNGIFDRGRGGVGERRGGDFSVSVFGFRSTGK